jgi:hypothetical protein
MVLLRQVDVLPDTRRIRILRAENYIRKKSPITNDARKF